ncbi:LYCOPENE BETA/EPSILON CYCLASE PROTEIN [Salix viminalis]|uniref:LYCOPENE BETA/EPSILON CYCLASE PROTEIN n=1 Tax=Salix viminalis TaxID=40686 RepID=A0A9Q0SEC3_SALVM|nr:LYCOPENE BETA/EPSILON CYCLASE PROTEIN [Salix viminalis]
MMMVQLGQCNGILGQYPKLSPLVRRRKERIQRSMSLQAQALPSRTQRIMESIAVEGEVGGAGGAYSYNALKRLDHIWSSICSTVTVSQEPQQVVSSIPGVTSHSDLTGKEVDKFDVVVCGGTLGIFIATALSAKGLQVGIVERNVLKGREQEWNISRKELLELVDVGILEENDIEQTIAMNFNPNRCGFEDKGEIWVKDILNLGVSPVKLVEIMKKRFISLGGVIFEGCSVSSISIYEDASVLKLSEGNILSSRLVIDAMGNFSPVVKQIRRGRKPDGVCLVVGSCARGFKDNSTSDIIYSSSSVKKVGDSEAQYFWEAFPAGSGPLDRTTYMFTYVSPQPGSPKLEELLEDFWDLMPEYQGVSLDNLEILRVIYGIFPTYRDSPLPAAFDRILQFGDASGIQSPVSFGGFGSLTRHLGRLSAGVYEAINGDFLDASSLSLLNPYMPNLSASWLFQRAMSAKKNSNVPPEFINELLHVNFQSMQKLGDPVLRPFLQDVIQFGALSKTLGLVMLTKPQIIPSIFKQVGIPVLLDWSSHFFMLGYYTFLSTYADPVIRSLLTAFPSKMKYEWKRYLEAWKYGSGLDYKL